MVEGQPAAVACFFHVNLAYSSIEISRHAEVIERCYWPLLKLPGLTELPVGIEASGWTLGRIADLEPAWIDELSALIASGHAELIGSGWAQSAAPLLPAAVSEWNLRLGLQAYEEIVGVTPRVALIAEQAYSAGLVGLFKQAGYEAIIVDWENSCRSHPKWPKSHGRFPQRARGTNTTLPVIWSQSIVFQKLQRLAHGQITLEEYVDFVSNRATHDGALVLYGNDAEVFDFRPGRFAAEPELSGVREWDRIAEGLRALVERRIGVPTLPVELLALLDHPAGGHELELTAADQPIPVKKQDKYNIARWACTGVDDVGINTRCWRLYEAMERAKCDEAAEWRTLCWLWSSDFRTHITEQRWTSYLQELEAFENRWGVHKIAARRSLTPSVVGNPPDGAEEGGSRCSIVAGDLELVLNAQRGLAIHSFRDRQMSDAPLFGSLSHGYFDTIELGADFYSGHLVQEAPMRHKVTDLVPVDPLVTKLQSGAVSAYARVATELGAIEKLLTLDPRTRSVAIEWLLHWKELPSGSLRLGYVTLRPEAFEGADLWYAAHNGGEDAERQAVGEVTFDHGAAVSALVTARQGLGLTEGSVLVGDEARHLRIDVGSAATRLLGLASFRPATPGYLFRLCFSVTEGDDTRRGPIARVGTPQHVAIRIAAGLKESSTATPAVAGHSRA